MGIEATGGENTQSVDKGGEGVDFESLFGKTTAELQETKESLSKVTKSYEADRSEFQKMQETVSKMRQAFVGDEAEASDPVAEELSSLQAEIDEWKDAAMKAERDGHPMPRTAKLGIENAKFRMRAIQSQAESQKEIKELKEKLNKVADPGHAAVQQLYNNTDLAIDNALNAIYGMDPGYEQVKLAQANAVARLIGNEFKKMQEDTENPQDWQRLQRDPAAVKKMVQHFVKQNIPPVARKLIEQEEIRKTPMGTNELMNAWREAKELSAKNPKDKRAADLKRELKDKLVDRYANGYFNKGKRFSSSTFE